MISRRAALAGLGLSLISVRLEARRPPVGWPGGVASLTYDDGLDSHLDIAAPALDRSGLHGTFYVTWENIAARADDWAALGRCGHEIANHTVHHRCDLRPYSRDRFAESELEPMRAWLDAQFGPERPRDFAYPCDVTDLGPGTPDQQAHRYALLLRRLGIVSARTSEGPPNTRRWVERAPFRLQALAVGFDTRSLSDVIAYLRRARDEERWAILVFHELAAEPGPAGTTTAGDHAAILACIHELGLSCRTVGQVMAGVRQTAFS